jgi:hypothetical protein
MKKTKIDTTYLRGEEYPYSGNEFEGLSSEPEQRGGE